MKKEIQSQIKDAVISIFIDKIISLSRIVDRLKEENENLRNSLISTLKNVFVVKNVMNIHGSINKVYSLQSEKVKTLITSQSKDTLNSLLHRDTSSKRIFSSIMNNNLPKTERMHSNKKVNINSSFTYYYDSNSKSSRKKELNTSAISTYHSKFSNCYLDSKLKDKLLCQSSLKKKNVLNLSISSVNNSQYIKTRNNSKSNIKIQKVQIPLRNKEYLNHKKRNYSMPKLSLSQLIRSSY